MVQTQGMEKTASHSPEAPHRCMEFRSMNDGVEFLVPLIKTMRSDARTLFVALFGYPNTGKSTLAARLIPLLSADITISGKDGNPVSPTTVVNDVYLRNPGFKEECMNPGQVLLVHLPYYNANGKFYSDERICITPDLSVFLVAPHLSIPEDFEVTAKIRNSIDVIIYNSEARLKRPV